MQYQLSNLAGTVINGLVVKSGVNFTSSDINNGKGITVKNMTNYGGSNIHFQPNTSQATNIVRQAERASIVASNNSSNSRDKYALY